MKESIRQCARELGFDDCRFTSAAPPKSAAHFDRWLEAGHHGEMAYLSRNAHKRKDPDLVLPGAKTIITLAASYAEGGAPGSGAQSGSPSDCDMDQKEGGLSPAYDVRLLGTIARYARYVDYHDVLARKLKTLTSFVDQAAGSNTRSLWYVDAGPLLERDFGQRAGLGFVGKHTNLISRKLGNWFFLSEIITTLEVEPDAPEHNRCGNCTRCISACPTAAITAPFELDARRCISYLTIELKGAIPIELRPGIGNRIFGCDDCLEACPWNRFAREGNLMRSHTQPGFKTPNLIELLSLDEEGFKTRFAGSPIWRTKRRGLLRNVCVALGNLGDRASLPALQKAAQDAEPLIAEHADWAIGRITSL